MFRRLWLTSLCSVIAYMALWTTPIPVLPQSTPSFQYVIPRFNAGSELILSNLSGVLASPEVAFRDTAHGIGVGSIISVAAGTELRLTAGSFGLSSFEGSVIVTSAVPLSVTARLSAAGAFETIASASASNTLIVPFSQGTTGRMQVTMFNPDSTQANVVISIVGTDGSILGSVNRNVPGLTAVIEDLSVTFPQAGVGGLRDISHVLLRAPSSIFGSDHRIFAQAEMINFSDPSQGVLAAHADFSSVTALPVSSAVLSGTIPFFVNGGDYVTDLQFINTSTSPGTVTVTARDSAGNVVAGTGATSMVVPAGGSVRRSVRSIFNLGAGTTVGSITFQSTTPVIATEAIMSIAENGFVVTPAATQPDTNYVFSIEDFDPQFFVGLTFLNPGTTPANVTVRYINDDGTAISSATLTLNPSAQITRMLGELMPEARNAGFIHVSSNVPIIVSALEGALDNSILAALPATHSQPEFTPPNVTRFLISGTIRHNGVPFPGVTVQLSGPVSVSTVTDQNGTFTFLNTPPGSYSLRPIASGFNFSPGALSVTITTESRRNNDFSASLIPLTITGVQQSSVVAGSPSTTIFVAGTPLMSTSQIVFEGNSLPTTLTTAGFPVNVVSATGAVTVVTQSVPALQATIDAAALAVPRTTSVSIRTTGPGGSITSGSATFTIGTAAPVLTTLGTLPSPLIAGNPGFSVTIAGSGFLPGVTARVNGVARPTTLQTPTTVQVTIPPEDLAIGGFLKITATNPSPTIGPSNALDLAVSNPVPVLLTVSPNSAPVELEPNMPPLMITVSGFGFKQGAKINFNGTEIPTTLNVPTNFQSATTLVGSIPQSSLLVGGAYSVTVNNPQPSLGGSNALPLLVSNLQPLLTSVETDRVLTFDPSRPSDSYPAPIVVRGSNFSTVSIFELSNTCTTAGLSVSPSSATVTIGQQQQFTAYLSGVATTGVTWSVNNVVGGNLTNGLISSTGLYTAPPVVPSQPQVLITATSSSGATFATAVVTVTSAQPTAGGVTGAGAVSATVINSHEANITITIKCAGTYSVDVKNPQPGGGVSGTMSFSVVSFVSSTAPQIASLSPSSVARGSASFALTINGSNFAPGALVNFGSAVLTPTAVTSGTITVTVPSYLLTVSDQIPVLVTNPDTGGASNRVLFTVN
jgi:hypothetical protein